MRKPLNKSGKKLVKKRGKDGRVRGYWMGHKKPAGRSLKNAGPEQPGFLRRHAGKIAGAAALVGLAALNRHKLMGAVRGAGLAHNAIGHHQLGGGDKVGLKDRAHTMFRAAKMGYSSNRGMDRFDRGHAPQLGHGEHTRFGGLRDKATAWRRGVGGDLAHHLATVGGEAAAGHIGARFGAVAGTAVGGAVAGPAGAGIGGFLGGHAGSFLAGRHTAPHIAKGAQWLANRMRR